MHTNYIDAQQQLHDTIAELRAELAKVKQELDEAKSYANAQTEAFRHASDDAIQAATDLSEALEHIDKIIELADEVTVPTRFAHAVNAAELWAARLRERRGK